MNKLCYKILRTMRSDKTFPSVFVILLICVSAITILYKEFFFYSTIIWSMNKEVRLEDLTPSIRYWAREHDGIETYCLYILVLAGIFLSFLILCVYRILLSRIKSFIFKVSYCLLWFFLLLNAFIFFFNIGFIPPMACPVLSTWTYLFAITVSVFIYFLFKKLVRFEKTSIWIVSIILIPFCFVATTPISLIDYSYIFAPALRMIHHFKLPEIYFQYDLLLSLVAALWMKLGLDLNHFQIMGQFSLYLFLLLSFFFSRRLFIKKELSFYLLTAMTLIKVYALMHDPVLCFQVTPLRLDWWLLLVILVYEKGLYSKWTGLSLGFLIIFHKTFGIIYALGYLETTFILLIIDVIKNVPRMCFLKATLKTHFKSNIGNIAIIVLSLGVSALVFRSSLESASLYQSIGIGFLPIAETSFYWYVAVMICVASIYLFSLRRKLPDRYFATGSFLIFLAIGNSIYFFGRSHEHNIINIAGSLVFVLFMLFDLLSLKYNDTTKPTILMRLSVKILPNVFILLLLIYYSGRINTVTVEKINNTQKLQFIYPFHPAMDKGMFRELTDDSAKVYFVGDYDFYCYYYLGYVPQGRFSPYASWIFKKDVATFLQKLVDNGYYIVFLDGKNDDVLSVLNYNNLVNKYGLRVIRK